MSDAAFMSTLFPEQNRPGYRHGVLPFQQIANMLREKEIFSTQEILPDQVQPASLDLRLGPTAYRVRASFLPGPEATVMQKIEQLDAYPIDITPGTVLEKECVYVIPLLESVNLKSGLTGFANPKSSTGRLDILTRLITDRSSAFDKVERAYQGPLFVEVVPRTFSVVVKTGTRLNQIRFRRGGSSPIASSELERLYKEGQLLLTGATEQNIKDRKMVPVTIDLHGKNREGLIGYRARKHTDRIDLAKVDYYDPAEFWEPIYYHRDPPLILDPQDFYILVTREPVQIPPDTAAEMVAYDTSVGEFRAHYAGFFDPGFGCDAPSRAVLEVRSHEVPFMLEHGQTVGWLQYERMADKPDRLYGSNIRSNYQGQGLALAKQFRQGNRSI